MATLVRNKHAVPVTLPYPFSGVLPGGGAVVLDGTPADILVMMGSQVETVFELHDVPDAQLLNSPVNGTYVPPASGVANTPAGTIAATTTQGAINELDGDVQALSAAKLFAFDNIAAKSTNGVHADLRGDAALNPFPGPFTNPVYPRNLRMVLGAAWDGGNVTITGTSPTDAVITEVITGTAGTTQVGVKVFKTVTAAAKAAVGADAAGTNVASIGTGDKLWVGFDTAATFGMLSVAGATEAVTLDATYNAFTPTTAPNGTVDYVLLVNVTPASV